MNFLEELVAEWYEYQGYFVRRNILVGKRKKGGYECELDVVAFNPVSRHLVHVEPSMDADSWVRREVRFRKKFEAGKRHIPALFEGLKIPKEIDQVALLGYGSKKSRTTLAGGRIQLVPELLAEIFTKLRDTSVATKAVPEDKPILRTLQYVSDHRVLLADLLDGDAG